MIVCDADNITDAFPAPTPEVIRQQWLEQTEALKDLRRRLTTLVSPRPVGTFQPAA